MRRHWHHYTSLGLVALCSWGCFTAGTTWQRLSASHLAATATSYNLAIEQTQNEMLLLNAIRAMNHQPMYITDASKVTGTVKVDYSAGFTIPVDVSASNMDDYMATPNFDYSTSPAMDINLLNSQDFMTGFLKTTPQQNFAYYWDREYPTEFMLYMLVLKVDVYEKTDVSSRFKLMCTLHNHPNALDKSLRELKAFATWVRSRIEQGRPTLLTDDAQSSNIGRPWPPKGDPCTDRDTHKPCKDPSTAAPPARDPLTFDALVSIATGTGLSLTPTDQHDFQLQRDKKVYTLIATPAIDTFKCAQEDEADGNERSWLELTENSPDQIVMGSPDDKFVFALKLRSAEGVLYYLGQLARLEAGAGTQGSGREVLIHDGDFQPHKPEPGTRPLFVALSKHDLSCAHDSVSVRTLGRKDYFIPLDDLPVARNPAYDDKLPLLLADAGNRCSAGRSMMALDLTGQLIALQHPPAGPPSGGGGGAAKDVSGAKAAKPAKPAKPGNSMSQ